MLDSRPGGSIVNISSYAGSHGTSMFVSYSCAEAGLEMLTRLTTVHALEMGYPIGCTTVAPGVTAPETVPATTVDRQCGSSQQAVHFAAQGVIAGAYDIAIACGVESVSRVPMFSNTVGADPYGDAVRKRYGGLVQQGISAELVTAR